MDKLANQFIIVIPVYNSEDLIKAAVYSTLMQNYEDLGIIIRDDLSDDRTPAVIEEILGIDGINAAYTKHLGKDIIYQRNAQKLYGGGNTYDSVVNLVANKQAIIGVVDGDDRLIDPDAVSKIAEVYRNKKSWLVWSQHQAKSLMPLGSTGCSAPLPKDEVLYESREYWSVSHFRTCKAWLFDELDKRDLIDPYAGSPYFEFAADAAFIYPITELCGNGKSFFLDEVLYLYNDDMPSNEQNKSSEDVARYTHYLRHVQPRYPQLTERSYLLKDHIC